MLDTAHRRSFPVRIPVAALVLVVLEVVQVVVPLDPVFGDAFRLRTRRTLRFLRARPRGARAVLRGRDARRPAAAARLFSASQELIADGREQRLLLGVQGFDVRGVSLRRLALLVHQGAAVRRRDRDAGETRARHRRGKCVHRGFPCRCHREASHKFPLRDLSCRRRGELGPASVSA